MGKQILMSWPRQILLTFCTLSTLAVVGVQVLHESAEDSAEVS